MSKKSVFCIATSRHQADQIVDQLKNANFSNNDISALFADKGTSHDFAHEKNTKAPEGAVTGAVTGGVVVGALGWIAGIGVFPIAVIASIVKGEWLMMTVLLGQFGMVAVARIYGIYLIKKAENEVVDV